MTKLTFELTDLEILEAIQNYILLYKIKSIEFPKQSHCNVLWDIDEDNIIKCKVEVIY